ncbi:MAG: hypothetical protein H0V17_07285 [Deltaproteobacteria bacterium]|nr:hypothetical protein [Deltaproteobacteria bacterium]
MLTLVPALASADRADDLVTEGQELGKQGRFREALGKFRAAEELRPRALHACLMGLAFLRDDQLGASGLAFADCRRRGTAAEPPPSWVSVEEQALAARLAESQLGTVELELSPEIIMLSTPAIADGDPLAASRTLYLPAGNHMIRGRSRDGRTVAITVTVSAKSSHTVVLQLAERAPVAPFTESAPKLPWIAIGSGAALATIGALVHVTALRDAHGDADQAAAADYDAKLDRYKTTRLVTVSLYAAGAAAIATGLFLRSRHKHAPQLSADVTATRAVLALEWHR